MLVGRSAPILAGRRLAGGAQVRWTGTAEGDLGHGDPDAAGRRRAVVDLPWTVLRQVHGRSVVTVAAPGEGSGEEADAVVTDRPGAAIAVLTADCAPIALASPEGVIGVVHAGWRGLAEGVIGAAVDAMDGLGAGRIEAVLGPCIRTPCYTFGAEDLERVAAAVGPEVRGHDRDGRPALDLAAGVVAALHRAGVGVVDDLGVCTACSPVHWSHRARRDTARQATVVWRP